MQAKLERAQSIHPQIQSNGEKAKLKMKGPDGLEKTYEIPILTGKDSISQTYRQHGGETLRHPGTLYLDRSVPV